jgi:hypothetical protein
MHLDFNSFSDEAVHVAGFGGKDLCVLKSDDMIMIVGVIPKVFYVILI